MILLISSNNTLVENFISALPANTPILHLDTIDEAKSHLNSQVHGEAIPGCLVVDAEVEHNTISRCQQLRQDGLINGIPIIAIIARPADRQLVLDAGADDYLLLPLVPVEVKTRLAAQEIFYLQEKTEARAMQNAFVVLLARMINEQLDLNTTLSVTLELTTPLLNASRGDIWLFSTDEQRLDLASSISHQFSPHPIVHRAKGQGLIGWVAQHDRSLHISVPTDDPRFDPQVDQIEGALHYALLAVPLQHQEKVIGVLAIYNNTGTPFSNQDAVVLEGVASLTTSAIVNARLMQELRDYADQQRVLYEMSQQIAAGLDFETTLNRTLFWVSRLSNAEIGLLWLAEKSLNREDNRLEDIWRLVATLGLESTPEQQLTVALEQGLIGWVGNRGESIMVNDPINDPRFDQTSSKTMGIVPRNIISVPMIYQGQTIGIISMLNKIDGPFDEADLALLYTTIEIIAVAVGNARLHEQKVVFMEEREHLHKQIFQAERLATVGRLTASLSHEINNPMQAIQGALSLAMEELHDPEEVAMYLRLSLQEADRVINLVSRMRQIYRPQAELAKTINLNDLLEEAITIARKELKRQKVMPFVELDPDLPAITAIANQLHLVFLSLILNLSDAIGATGGGNLQICSYTSSEAIKVEFSTDIPNIVLIGWDKISSSDSSQTEVDVSFGLSLSYDIIVSHSGTITLTKAGQQTICRIEFPLLSPADLPVSSS